MTLLTESPGLPAQLKLADPLLSPSTIPCRAQRSLSVKRTPRLLARAWISQGSQTLRKSMNRGGFPPDSHELASMVRRP